MMPDVISSIAAQQASPQHRHVVRFGAGDTKGTVNVWYWKEGGLDGFRFGIANRGGRFWEGYVQQETSKKSR